MGHSKKNMAPKSTQFFSEEKYTQQLDSRAIRTTQVRTLGGTNQAKKKG